MDKYFQHQGFQLPLQYLQPTNKLPEDSVTKDKNVKDLKTISAQYLYAQIRSSRRPRFALIPSCRRLSSSRSPARAVGAC